MSKLPITKLVNNTGQIDGVPANPRTIDKTEYAKLIKSIQEDPEYLDHEMPHVIKHGDKYVVLNGNQRLKALKELKFTEVPVTIYKEDTPPEVIRSRIIKSNHGYGKDDTDMLANEWSDDPLDEWGIDLPDDWLEQDKEVVEDEAPEVSDEPPVSKLGEIYQLGRHRVMCGDSTDRANVELLMDGVKADMVFTDPPYGMFLDADYSSMGGGKNSMTKTGGTKYENVKGDHDDFDPEFINSIFTNFPTAKEVFLWGGDYYAELLPNRNAGSWVVWDKRLEDSADKMYGSSFELCWSMTRHKRVVARIKWAGMFGVNSEFDKARHHPTQKPVALSDWFISKYSKAGDKVVDVFLGSGSTLIACEQTDRTCYGMELDPKYCDVIRKRYHKFVTGNEEGWQDDTKAV